MIPLRSAPPSLMGTAVLLSLLATALPAHADASAAEQAAADALFNEAQRLVLAGRAAEACPKFVESQRLDPALGTILNLADCLEKIGQTASAWALFNDLQDTAQRAGDK